MEKKQPSILEHLTAIVTLWKKLEDMSLDHPPERIEHMGYAIKLEKLKEK